MFYSDFYQTQQSGVHVFALKALDVVPAIKNDAVVFDDGVQVEIKVLANLSAADQEAVFAYENTPYGNRATFVEQIKADLLSRPSFTENAAKGSYRGQPQDVLKAISDLAAAGKITKSGDFWVRVVAVNAVVDPA